MRAPDIFKRVTQAHSEPSEPRLYTAHGSRSSVTSEQDGPTVYTVIARWPMVQVGPR